MQRHCQRGRGSADVHQGRRAVGYYDNSVKNRYNPSPDKEVYWAEQSWDEMFNPFFEYGVEAKTPTKGSSND